MKICFRNISSAKLKWKECTRRIKHDCFFFLHMLWLTQVEYFILNFPWLIFLVAFFFANYCHLLSFLKNYKVVMSLCILSNLFHHKYNDKNFSKGNKKPVSLRNQLLHISNFENKLHSHLCFYFVLF